MLRITTRSASREYGLKLEGWLMGAWVDEAARAWRAAIAGHDARRVVIDLSDVFFVDGAGRALLTEMYRAGAVFTTKGCVMPELVREIAAPAGSGRRS